MDEMIKAATATNVNGHAYTEEDFKMMKQTLIDYDTTSDSRDETDYDEEARWFLTDKEGIAADVPNFIELYQYDKEASFVFAAVMYHGANGEASLEEVTARAYYKFYSVLADRYKKQADEIAAKDNAK